MPESVRVPTEDELQRILRRGVSEIVPEEEFVSALRSGKHLRLKQGFDPTRPVITLGWTVGLRKLRLLQDLGHTVVVIIGDWTARIGDPSGKSETRPMLTEEEVMENSEAILQQFFKILDPERTEIRRQTEWFDSFALTDVVRLAARFTVAQILERDDFAQRFSEHTPIGIHELLYPLLQAYDSVAIESDVEFGGTDQKFNNLVGRELQRMMGQKSGPAGLGQAVYLVPLLVGLDGKKKMSQSLDNYIAIDHEPNDMYGKVMNIPDEVVADYFELLTDTPDEDVAAARETAASGGAAARDLKMRLGREIVAQFHGEKMAEAAEVEFSRVFSAGEQPRDVPQHPLSFNGGPKEVDIVELLHLTGLAPSKGEARRLVQQGAVESDGVRITEVRPTLRPGTILRIGKHKFLQMVDTESTRKGDE
jgi:tyrosyl-tRNA synthetase